jgi:hypothetical protein
MLSLSARQAYRFITAPGGGAPRLPIARTPRTLCNLASLHEGLHMICTPRAELACRIVEGEVVILDKQSGKIHQLNSTASFVWNRLDGHTPLPAIVSDMVREFDVEFEIARADVARVVADLVRLELVAISEPEHPTE